MAHLLVGARRCDVPNSFVPGDTCKISIATLGSLHPLGVAFRLRKLKTPAPGLHLGCPLHFLRTLVGLTQAIQALAQDRRPDRSAAVGSPRICLGRGAVVRYFRT